MIKTRPQAMTLTDSAAKRVLDLMSGAEEPVLGLRVGVKNGGCAGMEYTMELATDAKPFDEVVEDKGAKVIIDAKALMFLLGTQMDYQTGLMKSGFVFNNPNQTSACGCGESVELKPASVMSH
jgi:iron-sulfur cluster assembly protein